MIKVNRGALEIDGLASEIAAEFAMVGMSAVSGMTLIKLERPSKAFDMLLTGAYMEITNCSYEEAKEVPMDVKAKLIIDFLTDTNSTDGVPIPRKGIDY